MVRTNPNAVINASFMSPPSNTSVIIMTGWFVRWLSLHWVRRGIVVDVVVFACNSRSSSFLVGRAPLMELEMSVAVAPIIRLINLPLRAEMIPH